MKFNFVSILCLFLLSGFVLSCGDSGEECGRGLVGDSCLGARDCECDLRCVDNYCSDGESIPDGDETDGDLSEGDGPIDGDISEEDIIDGDVIDGDTSEKDITDGDSTEVDILDGDIADGDTNQNIEGEVWIDTDSHLMWQNPPDNLSVITWQEAMDYCDSLIQNGYDNWRLPSISELLSIGVSSLALPNQFCEVTDDCLSISCLTPSCANGGDWEGPNNGMYWIEDMKGPCSDYWSSSLIEENENYAFYVNFLGGKLAERDIYFQSHVRCVRVAE